MFYSKWLTSFAILIFLSVNAVFAQLQKGNFDGSLLAEQQSVSLNGLWQFYPAQLLTYEDFESYPSRSLVHLDVPGTWNSQGLPGMGYGTYRLNIKNLPTDKLLAISMPNIYSSYNLYVNGTLLAKNGTVGTDAASSTPQWLMKTIAFQPSTSEADIIIHVANFHHNRGGIHKPIILGHYEVLQDIRETEMLAQMMTVSGLLVLAIFFIAMFFIRINKKAQHIIFFALLCIAWAGRTFFAHIYLNSFFFPEMSWLIHVRLEYICLYFSLIMGNLFILKAFDLPRGLGISSLLMINILFVLITMALPPQVFTAMLKAYLLFAIINFIYITYAIVYAIVKEKPAAWYAGAGIILALLIFTYEVISYYFEWPLNHLLLQGAYLLVFIINSFILAHEFSRQDKKIEELEEKQLRIIRPFSK